MKTMSERRIIRGISLTLVALLVLVITFNLDGKSQTLSGYLFSLDSLGNLGFATLASLFPYAAIKRSRRERIAVLVIGALIDLALFGTGLVGLPVDRWSIATINGLSLGFGAASIVAVLVSKARNQSDLDTKARMVDFYCFVGAMAYCVFPLVLLTIVFHPIAYDAVAFHLDLLYGFNPSVTVAQFAHRHGWIDAVLRFDYYGMLTLFPLIVAMQFRQMQQQTAPVNFLLVWALSTFAVGFAYHFCPISGPGYYFGQDVFPGAMPQASAVPKVATLVPPAYRNGFPSMHVGWSLLILMMTRYQRSTLLKVFAGVVAGLTILATLALGEHYLIDLIGGVLFAVAIQSVCTHVNKHGQRIRWQAVGTALAFWVVWILLIKFGLGLAERIPGLVWLLSVTSVVVSLAMYRRIWRYEVWGYAEPHLAAAPRQTARMRGGIPLVTGILGCCAGFCTVFYALVLMQRLNLIFGATQTASSLMLALYLGGVALGVVLGGYLVQRWLSKVWLIVAMSELLAGVWYLSSTLWVDMLHGLYIGLAAGPDIGLVGGPTGVPQLVVSAAALLVPAILSGATIPALLKILQGYGNGAGKSMESTLASSAEGSVESSVENSAGEALSRLISLQGLGAALAALMTVYLLLPALGVTLCMDLAGVGSGLVAWLGYRLYRVDRPNQLGQLGQLAQVDSQQSAASFGPDAASAGAPRNTVVYANLVTLFLVSCAAMMAQFGYEQLLATVAGNSIYPFFLMGFSVWSGLAVGAWLIRHVLHREWAQGVLVPLSLLGLAATLLAGLYQWDQLPAMFGAYSGYLFHLDFAARETIRAIICGSMLFPPALLVGAFIPVALEAVTAGIPTKQTDGGRGRSWNRSVAGGALALALVLAGAASGVLLSAFIVLPMTGTLNLVVLAAVLCGLAGLFVALLERSATGSLVTRPLVTRPLVTHAILVLLALATAFLLVRRPATFNWTALGSGENIYFQQIGSGPVVDHSESLEGGLTTVAIAHAGQPDEVRTLLSNGKIEGISDPHSELKRQLIFVVAGLLQTTGRDHALAIGYGTGVNARLLKEAGFRHVDIVEPSADLINLADRYFADLNARVAEQDGVLTFHATARNYLQSISQKYALINVRTSAIWTSGSALLYNQEFYALAAAYLTDDGVLLQSVQLHHLSADDLRCILSTVRTVFPTVSLVVSGGQGVLVATKATHPAVQQSVAELLKVNSQPGQPGLQQRFAQAGLTADEVGRQFMLDPDAVTGLVREFSRGPDFIISTDDNLHIALSSPKGNALDGPASFDNVNHLLQRFADWRSPAGQAQQAQQAQHAQQAP